MKKTTLLLISFAAATAASQAAITFTNGNFENTTGTFPAGWTGAASAVSNVITGTSARLTGTNAISQDFAPTDADGLTVFSLGLNISFDGVPALNGANPSGARLRFRDNNNAIDNLTLGFSPAGVYRFSGSWSLIAAFSIQANTTYSLTVDVNGIPGDGQGHPNQYFVTIGDGTTSVTSAAITGYHLPATTNPNFETLTIDNASGAGLVVDNIAIIPEPTVALLGTFGLLGLLRRRR